MKVTQLFPTLCNPTDGRLHQARMLEWVAFPFSRGRPTPGIASRSPTLQVDSLPAEPQGKSHQGHESESEVAQSCPTVCDPKDCSLPGSSVHGIFQARILEWVAIFFSRGSSQRRDRTQVSLIVGRRSEPPGNLH